MERPIAAEVAEGRACLALIQTKLLALDTVTAVSDLGGATLANASSASEHTINTTWSKALLLEILDYACLGTHEWRMSLESCPLAVELCGHHIARLCDALTQAKGLGVPPR